MSEQRCLLISIFLVLWLGVVHSDPTSTSPPPPCSTPACRESAAFISAALNTSADPCNDFYEFACGGWLDKHNIALTDPSVDQFNNQNKNMASQIRKLLADFPLASSQMTNHSNAVTLAAYGYQKCLEQGNVAPEESVRQLKEVLQEVLRSSWSIGHQDQNQNRTWHKLFVQTFTRGSYSPIFNFGFYPDVDHEGQGILYTYPEALGFDDQSMKDLSINPKLVNAYKNYIRKSAHLFCRPNNCSTLGQDIEDILKLESALASLKRPTTDGRDPTQITTIPIQELSKRSTFNWLNEIFSPIEKAFGLASRINDSTLIRVLDINYTTKAVELLKTTPPRTIANLIGWRLVAKYGPLASEELREYAFEFSKVEYGLAEKEPRKIACYNHIGNWPFGLLLFATSRLFVDGYFSPAEKEEAQRMVDDIQSAFREILEKNSWLDEETRKNSILKLDKVVKRVGYPEWMLKNDRLDALYNLGNGSFVKALLTESNYLISLAQFNSNVMRRSIEKSTNVWAESEWILPPATVNAAYFPNSITIPAGILQSPFFTAKRPYAVNYGALATIIAHEFTHGFDNQGRQYDGEGRVRDWWTAHAVKQFEAKSECFVKQYGEETEPTTGLKLNGRNTLGENIADNGGVHVGYHAFQKRQSQSGPSPRLADLAKYSPEQLFFISWAHPWCIKSRSEMMRISVLYDTHSPGRFRATIPLANLPSFASTFNCPVGSKMNPTNRCTLW